MKAPIDNRQQNINLKNEDILIIDDDIKKLLNRFDHDISNHNHEKNKNTTSFFASIFVPNSKYKFFQDITNDTLYEKHIKKAYKAT